MEKETEKEPNELELWKKMYTDKENELEACKKKLAAAALILKRVADFNKNFEPQTLFGNEM